MNPHGVFSVGFSLNPVMDLGRHIDMAASGKVAWMTALETVTLIAGIAPHIPPQILLSSP